MFTMAVLSAGIPISLYPVLRKYNEALALGYVGFRTIEVVFFIVRAISLLTLLTLSQEFVIAGTQDASYFQILATLFWQYVFGRESCFQHRFQPKRAMYYYVLYRFRLIPRWLSGWGLVEAEPS